MKIPIEYIIELGLIRKRGLCAKCGKRMDRSDYNIQLCTLCRMNSLDKFANDMKDEEKEVGRWKQ